jgi:hypothetical protein
MIEALRTWLHRLHCVAYAGRGANATMTLAGETLDVGHCRRCGLARVLGDSRTFFAGALLRVSR